MVRVASELIPTLEDLPGGNVSQGNIWHPRSHFPKKLHSLARSELTGKVHLCRVCHNGSIVVPGFWMGIEACLGQFCRPNRTFNHARCPKARGLTSPGPCTRGVIVADFMDNGPLKGWGVAPHIGTTNNVSHNVSFSKFTTHTMVLY